MDSMHRIQKQLDIIASQMDSVVKALTPFQLNGQTSAPLARCEFCQGDHYSEECYCIQQDTEHDYYAGYQIPIFNHSWEFNDQDDWSQQQGGWDQQAWNQNVNNQWEFYTPPSFEARKPTLEEQMSQLLSLVTKSQKGDEEEFDQMHTPMQNTEMTFGQIAQSMYTRAPEIPPSDDHQCEVVMFKTLLDEEISRQMESRKDPNILHTGADEVLCSRTSHAEADEESELGKVSVEDAQDGQNNETDNQAELQCILDLQTSHTDSEVHKEIMSQESEILQQRELQLSTPVQLPYQVKMSLQVLDHSLIKPVNIFEDPFMNVEKIMLPNKFIFHDMKESKDILVHFGRLFLTFRRVCLRGKDNITFKKIEEKEARFDVKHVRKYPNEPKA